MRFAFACLHGFAVNIHRRADVGVAHQFLLHLHRGPGFIQERPERVPEAVPADASDTTTNGCGNDVEPN